MSLRALLSGLASGCVLLVASWSHAQCTKDTDCKGQRVCEAGHCVAEPAAPSPAATQPPAAASPTSTTPPDRAPVASEPLAEPAKPRMQRHSKGMMVGGIVMVSLAPVALLVSSIAALSKSVCNVGDNDGFDSCDDYDPTIYGSLIVGLGLVGGGIPLIVIGAKKEPVQDSTAAAGTRATATVSTWATPSAGGVTLRVDL